MENRNNFKFKNLSDNIKLSAQEKAFYRAEILKIVNDENVPNTKRIVSPFYYTIFSRNHTIFASLVLFIFLSTGLVFGAEKSLPTESLYQMRVKVLEPIQLLFTLKTEDKTKLKMAFIDQALNDFSKVTLQKKVDSIDSDAFAESISYKVKDLHGDISKLVDQNDAPGALKLANNLQSILSAKSIVLGKINKNGSNEENIQGVSKNIDNVISTTGVIVNNLTETVQNSSDDGKLNETINKQKDGINISFNDIKKAVEVLSDNKEKDIDSKDKNYIDAEILDINSILQQGNEQSQKGDKKAAFVLYNQVDQRLSKLKSLIDSDNQLGVGVSNDKNDTPNNTTN